MHPWSLMEVYITGRVLRRKWRKKKRRRNRANTNVNVDINRQNAEDRKRRRTAKGNLDSDIVPPHVHIEHANAHAHAHAHGEETKTETEPTQPQQFTLKSSSKQDVRKVDTWEFSHVEQEALHLQDAVQNVFLALTMEEEAEVNNALLGSNSEEILVVHKSSNIEITKQIFQCLAPKKRLNGDIISLYLELLKERERRDPTKFLTCHFFSTYFYSKLTEMGKYDYENVKKWTTHEKLGYSLLECNSILVPIHKQNFEHWCLGTINIREKKIQYFDSLNGRDTSVFNVLAQYIRDEVKDKCSMCLDLSTWKREDAEKVPKQENNFDCGMFVIKYADFHSRGMPLNFTQADIPYFRMRTAIEILRLKAD